MLPKHAARAQARGADKRQLYSQRPGQIMRGKVQCLQQSVDNPGRPAQTLQTAFRPPFSAKLAALQAAAAALALPREP
jgi:hypothetical protein